MQIVLASHLVLKNEIESLLPASLSNYYILQNYYIIKFLWTKKYIKKKNKIVNKIIMQLCNYVITILNWNHVANLRKM